MNFQSALMKPYIDAGLKSLAEACGYPVAAIKHSRQLKKKTLYFILESWEALYRIMLVKFLESGRYTDATSSLLDNVLKCLELAKGKTESEFRLNFSTAKSGIMKNTPLFYEQFKCFLQDVTYG